MSGISDNVHYVKSSMRLLKKAALLLILALYPKRKAPDDAAPPLEIKLL